MLSRRHPNRSELRQADVSGIRADTLGGVIGRTRIGTICTLWTESLDRVGGLARVTRVSLDRFVVDVVIGYQLMEVTRGAAAAEWVALHPTAAVARMASFVHEGSLMSSVDAAGLARGWVLHERLTREWIPVPLV